MLSDLSCIFAMSELAYIVDWQVLIQVTSLTLSSLGNGFFIKAFYFLAGYRSAEFRCLMKIVIAPDSYKECLSSDEVASAMAFAVRELCPDAEVLEIPLADGGEGTLAVLARALGADIFNAEVPDPIGRKVKASFGVVGETAVVEVAQACGLSLLLPEERNPLIASTRGLGELIMAARAAGCRHFIVGLGGSATCDGGAGMLSVCGVKDVLAESSFELLCDVDAPFVGPDGATMVFAPQKGASIPDLEILENRMISLAGKICEETGLDISGIKGAGAAGGLGGAFIAYAGAKIVSGAEKVMSLVGFDDALNGADLIITGEGKSDLQTLGGKVPYGVLRHSAGCRVALVSGAVEHGAIACLEKAGFYDISQTTPPEMALDEALDPDRARVNITNAVRGMLDRIGLGRGVM